MRNGLPFLLLAAVLLGQATLLRGFYWLLAWPGISFLVIAIGYLFVGPRVFGKRANGTMAWSSTFVLAPYLLLAWSVWRLACLVSGENCWNEAASGLLVGRRPLPHELPPGVTLIVDLTAEFPESRYVREGREYLCVPMLDGGVPTEAVFADVVERIARWEGPVYVHCAQGHGRTAMVAAAVLVRRGICATAEQALARLRAVRPGVRLSPAQAQFVARVCSKSLRTNQPTAP